MTDTAFYKSVDDIVNKQSFHKIKEIYDIGVSDEAKETEISSDINNSNKEESDQIIFGDGESSSKDLKESFDKEEEELSDNNKQDILNDGREELNIIKERVLIRKEELNDNKNELPNNEERIIIQKEELY